MRGKIKIFLLSVYIILGYETFAFGSAEFLPSTFSAEFEQSFVSTLTGKINKSRGIIDYKYPGHIKFDVTWPEPILFVANPEKSWHYTPPFIPGEKGQVSIRPSKNLMLFKFFDVLKEGLVANALYNVTNKSDEYVIEFKEKTAEEVGIEKSILKFNTAQSPTLLNLESATLFYKDKREVTLKLIDMRSNVEFRPEHFIFNEKDYPVTEGESGKSKEVSGTTNKAKK